MPTRYMEYTSHTRVGCIHDSSYWLVATDGSVARQKGPEGSSVQRMMAGVVLVRPVFATWADCPSTTDVFTDSLRDPTGHSPPPAALSATYLSAPNSPPPDEVPSSYNYVPSPSPESAAVAPPRHPHLILDALPDVMVPPRTPPNCRTTPSSFGFPPPSVLAGVE